MVVDKKVESAVVWNREMPYWKPTEEATATRCHMVDMAVLSGSCPVTSSQFLQKTSDNSTSQILSGRSLAQWNCRCIDNTQLSLWYFCSLWEQTSNSVWNQFPNQSTNSLFSCRINWCSTAGNDLPSRAIQCSTKSTTSDCSLGRGTPKHCKFSPRNWLQLSPQKLVYLRNIFWNGTILKQFLGCGSAGADF